VANEFEKASCKVTRRGTVFRGLVEGKLNGVPEYVARYVFKINGEGEATPKIKIRNELEKEIVEEFETEELEESTEVIS